MEKTIIAKFKNSYFISFILGALAYFMFLSYSQVVGGKYIVLEGDTINGFISGIKSFCNAFLNGEGIGIYSWQSYLGIDCFWGFMGLIFNINTPIFLLLNNFDIAYVYIVVLVLRAGLASLCFFIFVKKVWKINDFSGIIFSVFYSMCAFQTGYIPNLIGFSDAVIMLPLILYLVSKFAKDGSFKLMCLAYLYLFVNGIQGAYIVGFFSFFYLLLYMFFVNRYSFISIIKKTVLFGICIIFTAGLCGILLYPTAYFLRTKYAEDATKMYSVMRVFPWDFYNQLFVGQFAKLTNEYPYIYCGLPSLILIPFYFFNKKINKNEKIVSTVLLFLLIISGWILPLYLFWHCFDAPDYYAFRYSFIISFMICFMACRVSEKFESIKQRYLAMVVFGNIIFYFVLIFVQPLFQKDYKSYSNNTWGYLVINGLFILGYFIWNVLYRKYKNNKDAGKALILLIILMVMSETVINGYSAYFKTADLAPTNYYDSYKLWQKTMGEQYALIKENDDSFYRVNVKDDFTLNSSGFFGYNNITAFSNMENYEVRKTLGLLGLATSPRIIISSGLTDFTKMILGVKYEIQSVDYGDHKNYVIDYDQHASTEKNNYSFSLGFLVEDDVNSFEFSGRNQFININELASAMCGEKTMLYEMYEGVKEYDEVGIVLSNDSDSLPRIYVDGSYGSSGLFFINIPLDDRKAFVQFEYGSSMLDNHAPCIVDCIDGEVNQYERLAVSFIKEMSRLDEVYSIAIYMADDTYNNVFLPNDIYTAYYNYDEFIKLYNKLKDGQMDVIDYGSGWVDAHIDVNEDNKVLFTTIPYDEGWVIKVNGEMVEPLQLLEGTFIGLNLPQGSYDIEFRYHVPGLKTGAIISIISLLLIVGLFVLNPQFNVAVRPIKEKQKDDTEIIDK